VAERVIVCYLMCYSVCVCGILVLVYGILVLDCCIGYAIADLIMILIGCAYYWMYIHDIERARVLLGVCML